MTDNVDVLASQVFDALIANANVEHALVGESLRKGLDHAIACGEALTRAKAVFAGSSWTEWMRSSGELSFHHTTANWYMRIYAYRAQLAGEGIDSFKGAMKFLQTNNLTVRGTLPREKIQEVAALVQAGHKQTEVAKKYGISKQTVYYHARGSKFARQAAHREERQRVIEQKLDAGGAISELYTLTDQLRDALIQAKAEVTAPRSRAALERAAEHCHAIREEIAAILTANRT